MTTTTDYLTRAIRPLGVRAINGWQMKLHGIAAKGETPRPAVVEAGVDLAERVLPKRSGPDGREGYGFVVIHEGESACYYLIFRWSGEIFLNHHIFIAPLGNPRAYNPVGPGVFPCAWELVPVAHEREAWVATMLADGPDPDRYLADTLSRDA
jgi:hypothetical protein